MPPKKSGKKVPVTKPKQQEPIIEKQKDSSEEKNLEKKQESQEKIVVTIEEGEVKEQQQEEEKSNKLISLNQFNNFEDKAQQPVSATLIESEIEKKKLRNLRFKQIGANQITTQEAQEVLIKIKQQIKQSYEQEQLKKKERMMKFGITTLSQDELEMKKLKRLERFGQQEVQLNNFLLNCIKKGMKAISSSEFQQKKLDRAKRFGSGIAIEDDEKLKMRAQKFGTVNAELEKEKIKLRAMKFGVNEPIKKVKF